jgi:hypothetical protein
LVTLVGGAATTSGKTGSKHQAADSTRRAFGKSDEMYHHISSAPRKPARSFEHALPLEDGDDGLEHFNG